MPTIPKDPYEDHLTERLTLTTKFFEHDQIADLNSPLSHTMPDLATFEESMSKLQVKANDLIVCYDNLGIFSAPRAFHMLRFFGAQNVRVLNGGLKKWKIDGLETVGGPQEEHLEVGGEDPGFVIRNPEQVIMNIDTMYKAAFHITRSLSKEQIVDARSSARFTCQVDEPRPGLRRGNIAGSKNLPFTELL